ncbi:MAG TPA: hypothetical protein DEF47_08610 [Herpetosiphon sp.]|nr:FixH family protein [Herpetosiphon sp.]HBW49954.1 hypothetical protein [Herpetosiphon sp.]
MSIKVKWIVLLLWLGVSLSACSRAGSDDPMLQAHLEQTPNTLGQHAIIITIQDNGAPLTTPAVQLETTMSHAGMASQMIPMESLGDGRYTANLNIDMLGEWVFIVHVPDPTGATSARQKTLPAFNIQ